MHVWTRISLTALFSLVLLVPTARADDAKDLEALLTRLERLRKLIDQQENKRLALATEKFREGAKSSSRALALYYECKHLVDFEQKGDSYVDFRRWKERNGERIKESDTPDAYRVQLAWLVILMEAGHNENDAVVSRRVLDFLDQVVAHAKNLAPHRGMLRESVLGTVFAQAYGLDRRLSTERLGTGPLDINKHFDGLIFPAAREKGLTALASAWDTRIDIETKLAKEWRNKNGFEEFQKNIIPALRWQRGIDLMKSGAPKTSGLRELLVILEANTLHPSASKWIDELLSIAGGVGPESAVRLSPLAEESTDTEINEPAPPEDIPSIAPDEPQMAE